MLHAAPRATRGEDWGLWRPREWRVGEGGVIFRSAGGIEWLRVSRAREVRATRAVVSPLTIVPAMACIGSSRLCAHVERLCQFGHFAQLRRKVSTTTCVKSRPLIISRTDDAQLLHCQVRLFKLSHAPDVTRVASSRRPTTRRTRHDRENALSHSIFRDFRRDYHRP